MENYRFFPDVLADKPPPPTPNFEQSFRVKKCSLDASVYGIFRSVSAQPRAVIQESSYNSRNTVVQQCKQLPARRNCKALLTIL